MSAIATIEGAAPHPREAQEAPSAVLVVDDEERVAAVLARGLNRAGYRTEVAYSGAEALARLARRRFDVLLSDIRMPRMRGDELQRIARERDPELVAVLITAEYDVNIAVDCLKQGVYDYLTKPFDLSDVVRRVGKALERREALRADQARQMELERRVAEQTEQLEKALRGPVSALVHTLKAKDRVTHEHSERVSRLATALARRVFPSDEALAVRVQIAGQLHDIGKIGIPDGILMKGGALDAEEMEQIRRHPLIGVEILKPLLDGETVAMVRGHHEQIGGGGYPDGLTGEDIPLGARLIAVTDAYDALTSERPYKPKITERWSVLDILQRGANRHWDENIVESLIAMEADGELREIVPPPTSLREAWSIAVDLGDIGELYLSVPSVPRQPAPSKSSPAGADPEPVICAKGSIEGNTLLAILAAFEARLERGQTEIILDILRCDAITPEGAQRIYEMDQRARRSGGQLVVRDAALPVRRMFEDAGLARTSRFQCSDKA